MSKRQGQNFKLIRSGILSFKEIAVMNYVYSYSEYCAPPTMQIMASNLKISVRTLRTVINMLVMKGILEKTYRAFKKIKLKLKSVEEQGKILGGNLMKTLLSNTLKLKKKMSDRQNGTHLDRQTQPSSIENKTIKNKTINIDNNFFKKRPFDLNSARNEAIAKFKEHLSTNKGVEVCTAG